MRNDEPILVLNRAPLRWSSVLRPLQHIPDLALQVKARRDARRYHSFANGIVHQFVHCFVAGDLHSLGELDQLLDRKFTFSNHRKQ